MPVTFDKLKSSWRWKEIRGCPGRFVLRGHSPLPTVQDLVGDGIEVRSFRTDQARDLVLVAPLEGGGLISYARPDGSCVHTLNTEEGFRRKLAQLGIEV